MAGSRGGGFELYLRLLNEVSLMDDELCFSSLSRFGPVNPDLVAAYQYKRSDPSAEPAHWSIYSLGDVGTTGQKCGFRVVLYNYDNSGRQCPPVPARVPLNFWIQRAKCGDKRLTLWHDRRVEHGERAEEEPPLCVLVATTASSPRRLFCLPAWQAPLLDACCHVWFADVVGPVERVGLSLARDGDGNYLKLVDKLLGLEQSDDDDDDVEPFRISRLTDFWLADRHKLFRRWSSVAGCVVLLTFEGRRGKPHVKCWTPKNLNFCCLAITSELNPVDVSNVDFVDHATPDAKVVLFYGHTFATLLSEPYKLQALTYHLDTRGLAQKLFNRSDLSSVPRVLPQEQVDAAKAAREAKKRPRAGRGIVKKCSCRDCASSRYTENMASAGPERLCSVALGIKDLLRMLGALTSEADAVIARMVKLSVASMDVESLTTGLDLRGPRPGPRTSYPEIGGPILEGHLLHVQRPIMVGHTDALMREAGERWQDVVEDDSPKAVYEMFARYWLKIGALQRRCSQAKRELCETLLELASRYDLAFWEFANRWQETSRIQRDYLRDRDLRILKERLLEGSLTPEHHAELARETVKEYHDSDDWVMAEAKALGSAFRNSLPGLLRHSLKKLCARYVVFNFYG